MKLLGSRIAEARKRRGITQRELADAAGVSVQAVSQWENGKTDPTQRADAITNTLGYSPSVLSGNENFPEEESPSNQNVLQLFTAPLMEIDDLPEYLTLFGGRFEPNSYYHIDSTVKPIGRLFASYIRTASAYFNEGDLLIFDTGLEPISGDLCAVITLSAQLHLMPSPLVRPRLGGAIGDIARKTAGENAPLLPLINAEKSSTSTLVVGTMVEHRTFRSGRPTA